MSKRRLAISLLLGLTIVLLVACAPKAAPAAPQAPGPAAVPAAASAPAASIAAAPAKPAWQQKWDDTLAAAKKEGRVAMHTGGGAAIRGALMDIARAQGLDPEVVSTRSDEFQTKVLAERRAGLYLYDIWLSGASTMVGEAKPAGVLQSMDSALILPDLTDPERIKKVWYKGELAWVDQGHAVFATTLTAQTPIVINTNLVKDGEIKSWKDLLDPKWKGGKILVNDPSGSAGQLGFAAIEGIMGWDYIKEIAKMEPIVLRDQRQQLEWLAHGKAYVLIPPKPDVLKEFLKLGVPIKALVPSEGTWVSTGSSGLGFISREPHPNAARVFINALLSKEGQTVFSLATSFQSTREDVPTDHLRPEDVRQEGVKYFKAYTEQSLIRTNELRVPFREMFGPLMAK